MYNNFMRIPPEVGGGESNRLFAWGWNEHGRLGDGTTTTRRTPTLIGVDTWQEIAAGGHHSLGIRADGRLFAWGRNWSGQLGDGTTIDRHIPILS